MTTTTTTTNNDAAAFGFGPAALEPTRDAYDVARWAASTLAELSDAKKSTASEFYRLDYKNAFFGTISVTLSSIDADVNATDSDAERLARLCAQYQRDAERFARRAVQIYNNISKCFDEDERDALFSVRRTVVEIAQEEARLIASGILFPVFYRRAIFTAFRYSFIFADAQDEDFKKFAAKRYEEAHEEADYYERVYPDICRSTQDERDALAREAVADLIAPITD